MLFALSFKLLWRELKSGQLTVMFAAIVLSVTSVSCISIFSDRLQQALFLETREFLGGDLKYDSNEELNEKELEGINNNEIKQSRRKNSHKEIVIQGQVYFIPIVCTF